MMALWQTAGGVPVTSYANAGGTGNRTASVTVTVDFTPTAGVAANLVNGSFVADASNSLDPPGNFTGPHFRIDFGSGVKKYIDELKLTSSSSTTVAGFWDVRGSNDATNWTVFTGPDGGQFLWDSAVEVVPLLGVAPTGYRYYEIFRTVSTSFGAGWIEEFEFKIADGAT